MALLIEFEIKFPLVYRYTYLLTGICLVLTFFGFINQLNYLGASLIIATMILDRCDLMKYGVMISGIGSSIDLFHLIFKNSDSNWHYIRYLLFVKKLFMIVFQLVWILFIYIYMSQESVLGNSKQNFKWIENQLSDLVSNIPDNSKSPTLAQETFTSISEGNPDDKEKKDIKNQET